MRQTVDIDIDREFISIFLVILLDPSIFHPIPKSEE